MIPIEELLKPIAEDKPTGEDCGSGDLSLQLYQLEELARGTPGQERVVDGQMVQDPPGEPKWRDVESSALDLLRQSKHLRVLVILMMSELRLEGLPGLRDGLAVLAGWLKQYWPTLWPALDPADNNDPQERLNLLSELGGERFIRYVDEVVVGQSAQMGRATVADLRAAQAPAAAGGTGLTPDQVQAILRDTDRERLAATRQVAGELQDLLRQAQGFFTETLGPGQWPDWQGLADRFDLLAKATASYLEGGALPTQEGTTAAAGAPTVATRAAGGPAGGPRTIGSRQDVVAALEEICRYYQQHEPSSPVPLLLRRAQRLAGMDFVAALNELLPDAVPQLKTIAGQLPESGGTAA